MQSAITVQSARIIEPRNAQAWREIAYFLCAQADGLRFVGATRPAAAAAGKRSAAAAAAGPRAIPDGNHGDNTSLADDGAEQGCPYCGSPDVAEWPDDWKREECRDCGATWSVE